MKKLRKLLLLSRKPSLLYALIRHGVAASVEHVPVLRSLACQTVVDIGANRGQFALAARACFPRSQIVSFEPLHGPANKYREVFRDDALTTLVGVAIGPLSGKAKIHVSARDDSSSLLPISSCQSQLFPGTEQIRIDAVKVSRLAEHLSVEDIASPALLKLDVQGFELAALYGCSDLLHCFEWVYAECSFLELYEGQALVADVIAFLHVEKFGLVGVYHTAFDLQGRAVQADFLFRRIRESRPNVEASSHVENIGV